jgi:haloalkane dehalogenase
MTTTVVRPDWLTYDVWPYDVSAIATPAGPVAVTDTGTGDVVLLVHTGMWSIVWRDVIAELARDHRVVTLDAPGTGVTATLLGAPDRPTLADAALAVTAVVEALDLRDLVLVFHDLGGTAALSAAALWPQRVKALAAINTFGWAPHGTAFVTMLRTVGGRIMTATDAATGFLPALSSTRAGVGRRWSRAVRAAFRAGMRGTARAQFHAYMGDALRHDYTPVDQSLAALADRPIVTVFGEKNDPLGFQPQWLARFPRARQVVIRGGNHFPMCDDPATTAAAIAQLHR